MHRILITIALLILAAAASVAAQGGEEAETVPRVAVGHVAPSIALVDAASGDEYRLESLRGEKDLVVVFFRGAW